MAPIPRFAHLSKSPPFPEQMSSTKSPLLQYLLINRILSQLLKTFNWKVYRQHDEASRTTNFAHRRIVSILARRVWSLRIMMCNHVGYARLHAVGCLNKTPVDGHIFNFRMFFLLLNVVLIKAQCDGTQLDCLVCTCEFVTWRGLRRSKQNSCFTCDCFVNSLISFIF